MKKISIRSDEFTKPITEVLNRDEELVIWHQIPWSGGAQEWYLIRSVDALDQVLGKGQVASAFTVYKWLEVTLPDVVNQVWFIEALNVLAKTPENDVFLLGPAMPGNELIELVLMIEEDDLTEWFEEHTGAIAIAGHTPCLFTGEVVRGYYPDAYGVPQSGPY